MPLLSFDADAHPFLLIEVEAFAFVGPDPGLFCGVAVGGMVRYMTIWNAKGEQGKK